jgi:hypothetical protein
VTMLLAAGEVLARGLVDLLGWATDDRRRHDGRPKTTGGVQDGRPDSTTRDQGQRGDCPAR